MISTVPIDPFLKHKRLQYPLLRKHSSRMTHKHSYIFSLTVTFLCDFLAQETVSSLFWLGRVFTRGHWLLTKLSCSSFTKHKINYEGKHTKPITHRTGARTNAVGRTHYKQLITVCLCTCGDVITWIWNLIIAIIIFYVISVFLLLGPGLFSLLCWLM